MNSKFLTELKENYGIVFNNSSLLREAFMHSSYANEHRDLHLSDNERLEFLGDAVLQFLISKYIFDKYSQMSEGELSPLRSFIVREESLASFAKACNFDAYIRLGKGEEASGGRQRLSLLCDLFEAFIGALVQDQGLAKVQDFVGQVMVPKIDSNFFLNEKDYKTILQEELQKKGDVRIEYRLAEEVGPAHDRLFFIEAYLDDKRIGEGSGKSKKQAEQKAAENALDLMEKNINT